MSEFSADKAPKAANNVEGGKENRVINRILLGFMEESEKLQMTKPEFSEVQTAKIFHVKGLTFNLTAGPIDLNSTHASGKPIVEEGEDAAPWYVLQIEYGAADKTLKDSLPLHGWSSNSGSELGREANRMAQEFCDKNGFTPVVHVNSWPDFKALIYKNEPIPTFASEEEEEEWNEERRRKLQEELDAEDEMQS